MTDPIEGAWLGRISGCQLGKAVEGFSMGAGVVALRDYLSATDQLPLRDYIALDESKLPDGARLDVRCTRGRLQRAEVDDDINYSVLALSMLERRGLDLTTADVARTWLRSLPAGITFTAERAAYATLLSKASDGFPYGADPGFDLSECSDNPYNDWIGATIRADVYGWVVPGRPSLAAELARRDAALSHRAAGVDCPAFVAAVGAAIPGADSIAQAIEIGRGELPPDSDAVRAIDFARSLAGADDAVERLHAEYGHLHAVHAINNLAVVVWALLEGEDDYSVAIGEAVAAGWDTDCNGATVGGLWGLTGGPIPEHWTTPWNGAVRVGLAGVGELRAQDLITRTKSLVDALA